MNLANHLSRCVAEDTSISTQDTAKIPLYVIDHHHSKLRTIFYIRYLVVDGDFPLRSALRALYASESRRNRITRIESPLAYRCLGCRCCVRGGYGGDG